MILRCCDCGWLGAYEDLGSLEEDELPDGVHEDGSVDGAMFGMDTSCCPGCRSMDLEGG